MELKRILARDSRTANEKAIQLYGKEVMIISSQRVDNQIELVVAVDTGTDREQAALDTAEKSAPRSTAPTTTFGKVLQDMQLAPVSGSREDPIPEPAAWLIKDAGQAEAAVASANEVQRSQEIVSLLRQEIATLREDLLLTMRSRMAVHGSGMAPVAQDIMHRLAEAGMPSSMQLLFESTLDKVQSVPEGLSLVGQTLYKTMKRKVGLQPMSGWHALVGPSGSGKTSMVARLAQVAAQAHGAEKQAIISFQDTRAGAWAQIQVLASQVGVDCFRAQDLSALRAILEDLGPKRTVWVDTTGVNFMANIEQLQSVNLDVHALLPVDATATHTNQVLLKNERLWASLMLSKLDEATPTWALIRGLCDTRLPVSWMVGHEGHQPSYDPQLLIDRALIAVGMEATVAVADKPKAKAARRPAASPRAPVSRKPRQTLTKAVHG